MKKKAKNDLEVFEELPPMQVNVVDQNLSDYENFALFVLSNRAIASLYGFKPVQLRLIFCMWSELNADKKTVKCASIVGRTLEKFHPHGDVAAYGALAPMANWFDAYIPLIKKQGNFGSFQGDGPAHYRYTEAGLSNFTNECIVGELNETKQVVDWEKNYSESCLLPIFLPIKVPILLVNGTTGIGVGIKCDIPTHNLGEVIDATLNLIKNPNAKVVLVPDHCMPCEIIDTNWKSISNTGNGTYLVRGIVETGEYAGHPALFIRSLPNRVYLDSIKDAIDKLKLNNELPQVIDVKEDCRPDNLNCIIELKRGSDTNYVKQVLYKKTRLQTTDRLNFEVFDPVEKKLVRMSYKSYLQFFIEFRKITKFRLYCGVYQDTMTRLHAIEMYIELMNNNKIDDIIDIVRHNKKMSDPELIEYLIKKYGLTDLQSSFVVNNELKKISPVHLAKYMEEYEKLKEKAAVYYDKIVHEDQIIDDIYAELVEIKKKYATPRRCHIIGSAEASGIPEGEFKIVISENNFIRKVPLTDGIGSFRDDKPKFVVKAQNTSNLIIFDEKGRVYRLPVSKISLYDKRSNGLDIRILLKNLTSNITTVIPEDAIIQYSKKIDLKYFLTCVSRNGSIKKLDLEDLLTVPANGFIYMKLDDDDIVQDVMIISDVSDIIVYSHTKALRFSMNEVPLLKRFTKGNKAMASDYIDGVSVIRHDTTDIVVVTVSGYVNRFNVAGLERSTRAKAGSRVIKLHKGDAIRFIYGVNVNDQIKIVTNNNTAVFNVSDLKEGSSIGTGDKLIPTRDVLLKCMIQKREE